MKLYLKQKVFSWGDKFTVFDENGSERFFVKGEVFTFGKKLHLLDLYENELAFIHQKVLSFLPRYFISRNGEIFAEVVKQFTFLRQEYVVKGLNWSVKGAFFAHEYEIYDSCDRCIVRVSKKWFTFGDSYEIDINDNTDIVSALSVVLVIDACLEAANVAVSSSN